MSPKLKFFIGAVLLVALVGGASVLYTILTDSYEPVIAPPTLASNDEVQDNQEAQDDQEVQDDQEEQDDQTEADAAPDFEMHDVDMNLVNLSDFFGKPIVMNFWTTWCPACRTKMPYLQAIYDDIGDEVQFVMVALVDGIRETIRTVETFIENEGYTFPVFYDTMGGGVRGYQIFSIPTTVLIDSNGNLAGRWVGMVTEEQIRGLIDEME